MIRRSTKPLTARRAALFGATALALAVATISASCASPVDDRVVLGSPDPEPPAPSFPSVDGGDAAIDTGKPVLMCVSNECAAPWATCPASESLCDTNLESDPKNCGACGNACPSGDWIEYELQAKWECVQGSCKMLCSDNYYRDCDGFIENGCETRVDTEQNCGACGTTCPQGYECNPLTRTCFDTRCLPPATNCNGNCLDLRSDDYNCGECNRQCNQNPPDAGRAPFAMYYGCVNSACEELKCVNGYKDCDGVTETNGCEVNIATDPKNCGGCGIACPAGDICENGTCICDPGPDGCGCTDLSTDVDNCGSCGFRCPGGDQNVNGKRTCKGGHCGYECTEGYADCNNDREDGCEINIRRDPQHCGTCTNTCTTGQACKDGACATKPCPDGPIR